MRDYTNDFEKYLKHGHFEIAGGMHTDLVIDNRRFFCNVEDMFNWSIDLASLVSEKSGDKPVLLVGSDDCGALLAHLICSDYKTILEKDANCIFVDKNGADEVGSNFSISGHFRDLIGQNIDVWVVDDVLVTGNSVKKITAEVRRLGGKVAGTVVLFNRGGLSAENLGLPYLIALHTKKLDFWRKGEEYCKLCREGVPVVAVGHGRDSIFSTRPLGVREMEDELLKNKG